MQSEATNELIAAAAKAAFEVDHPNVAWWSIADIVKRRYLNQMAAAFGVFAAANIPIESSRVIGAIQGQRRWFVDKADAVLARIRTESTEDVKLYHDAVSVFGAARHLFDWAATIALHTDSSGSSPEPDRASLIAETALAEARARRGVTAHVNESDRRAAEATIDVVLRVLGCTILAHGEAEKQ